MPDEGPINVAAAPWRLRKALDLSADSAAWSTVGGGGGAGGGFGIDGALIDVLPSVVHLAVGQNVNRFTFQNVNVDVRRSVDIDGENGATRYRWRIHHT